MIYVFYESFVKILFHLLNLIFKNSPHPKMKRFLKNRNPNVWINCVKELKQTHANKSKNQKLFWLHAASAGEFQQALPIVKSLGESGDVLFFVTYFSPEAEPFLKNHPYILGFCSLPLDLRKNYELLFKTAKIDGFILVRYDFWPALIKSLKSFKVPMFLLAATLKTTKSKKYMLVINYFQKVWRIYLLRKFDHLFLSHKSELQVFKNLGLEKSSSWVGDPKWVQACARTKKLWTHGFSKHVQNLTAFTYFQRFQMGKTCFVFGSPHHEELYVAIRTALAQENTFLIVVPHQVDGHSIQKTKRAFTKEGVPETSILVWSQAPQMEPERYPDTPDSFFERNQKLSSVDNSRFADLVNKNIVIVDSIGWLTEIYATADIAVIGGGFDGELHNTLESASHGIPTVFGNRTHRAQEAKELLDFGCAKSFESPINMFHFLCNCARVGKRFGSAEKQTSQEWSELLSIRSKSTILFENIPDTSEIVLQTLKNLNAL